MAANCLKIKRDFYIIFLWHRYKHLEKGAKKAALGGYFIE